MFDERRSWREVTATHEAGHVLAAEVLSLDIPTEIVVRRDGLSRGYVDGIWTPEDGIPCLVGRAVRHVVFLVAGDIASRRRCPPCYQPDRHHAERLAARIARDRIEPIMRLACDSARLIVGLHRPRLKALARKFLQSEVTERKAYFSVRGAPYYSYSDEKIWSVEPRLRAIGIDPEAWIDGCPFSVAPLRVQQDPGRSGDLPQSI